MSSCKPTDPAADETAGRIPCCGGETTTGPRGRGTRSYKLITRVLYREAVVVVTPGCGRVVVIFTAIPAESATVHRPDHPHLGARAVVHRAYLKIVDKAREQGE